MGMETFHYTQPRLQDNWRSVMLFGRNVASFNFALGKSPLELTERGPGFVNLEELAEQLSRYRYPGK